MKESLFLGVYIHTQNKGSAGARDIKTKNRWNSQHSTRGKRKKLTFIFCVYFVPTLKKLCSVSQLCPTLCYPWLQPARFLSMDFSGKNGCHLPPPVDLPNAEIETRVSYISPTLQEDSLPAEPLWKAPTCKIHLCFLIWYSHSTLCERCYYFLL